MSYRILSLDGGGLRGVVSARLLSRLGPAWQHADLIAGTSTGGILALGLAAGFQPHEMEQFYFENGPAIFDRGVGRTVASVGGLFEAKYDNANLKKVLQKYFADTCIKDVPSPKLLIAAFDLENGGQWKPKFFDEDDGDETLVDVGLATSAAPTYFPSYNGFIDGGVFANNPSMAAVAQALSCGVPLSEIRLLSIGTGFVPESIPGDRLDWGKIQWAKHIVDLLMNSVEGVADYQCRHLLRENYFRLNMQVSDGAMDDVSAMPRLIQAAEVLDITCPQQWLKENWR